MANNPIDALYWYDLGIKNNCCFFGQKRALSLGDLEDKLLAAMYEHKAYNNVGHLYFIPNDQFNRYCYMELSDKLNRILLVCKKEKFVLDSKCRSFDSKPNPMEMEYGMKDFNNIDYCDWELKTASDYYRRNKALIDKCSCCIFYYDPRQDALPTPAVPTADEPYMSNHLIKQTYLYALRMGKKIINIYNKEKDWE